jgi:hypothetical protein
MGLAGPSLEIAPSCWAIYYKIEVSVPLAMLTEESQLVDLTKVLLLHHAG